MKSFFIGLAVLTGLILLPTVGAVFGLIRLPFLKFEKKVELNQGVINKTFSTEYCLGNYEWFKDTFNDIEQSDAQIANAQKQLDDFVAMAGPRTAWTFEDKQQHSRIADQVTGLKNYRADLVGQYNSRTGQLNRVACKELPLFISL